MNETSTRVDREPRRVYRQPVAAIAIRLLARSWQEFKNKDATPNPTPNPRELYRIRQGRYRILYEIQDDILLVIVVKAGKRSNVYR